MYLSGGDGTTCPSCGGNVPKEQPIGDSAEDSCGTHTEDSIQEWYVTKFKYSDS